MFTLCTYTHFFDPSFNNMAIHLEVERVLSPSRQIPITIRKCFAVFCFTAHLDWPLAVAPSQNIPKNKSSLRVRSNLVLLLTRWFIHFSFDAPRRRYCGACVCVKKSRSRPDDKLRRILSVSGKIIASRVFIALDLKTSGWNCAGATERLQTYRQCLWQRRIFIVHVVSFCLLACNFCLLGAAGRAIPTVYLTVTRSRSRELKRGRFLYFVLLYTHTYVHNYLNIYFGT